MSETSKYSSAIIDGGCLIDEFSKETLEKACRSGVQVTVEPVCLQNAKALIASRYPDIRCEAISEQSLQLYEKINPADLNRFGSFELRTDAGTLPLLFAVLGKLPVRSYSFRDGFSAGVMVYVSLISFPVAVV